LLEQAGLGVVKGGTLYPVLNRLETDGFLDVSWRPSEKGPNRKYYTLTAAGMAALDEAAKEWKAFAEATTELMTFGHGRGR
jgi:PadR family transcriptional regulator PadR